MADNGGGENADELNSSSFLDSSLAGNKYEVCTGPVSDGEKAYLLRHGLALEDSRGELYGEPSTILDFEDSDESLATKDTPSPKSKNKSFTPTTPELRRSNRRSRATTPCIKCHMDSLPMSSIENQMSQLGLQDDEENSSTKKFGAEKKLDNGDENTSVKHASAINSPACKTTPKRGSKRFNDAPIQSPLLSQVCRVTRSSVKRDIELLSVSALALKDGLKDIKEQGCDNESDNKLSLAEPGGGGGTQDLCKKTTILDSDKQQASLEAVRPLPAVNLENDVEISSINLNAFRASVSPAYQLNQGSTTGVEVNANGFSIDTIEKEMNQPETAELNISTLSHDSELQKKSIDKSMFDESSSSGEEFDDTITRMEKILAMAEEQEQEDMVKVEDASFKDSEPTKGTEKQIEGKTVPRRSEGMKKPTAPRISFGTRAPTPITKRPVPASMAKQSSSPLTRILTPGGSGASKTPLSSRAQADGRSAVTPTKITPIVAPLKTPSSGHITKTAFFPSSRPGPSPRPGSTFAVGTCTKPAASPLGSSRTPAEASPRNFQKEPNKGTANPMFMSPLPPRPSPLFLHCKREGHFRSPVVGLQNKLGGISTSISTPLRPFTEPQSIQEAITSPVSTIYPSPVAKTSKLVPVKPIPLPLQKVMKDKVPSPSAVLKKNYKKGANAISSPVAEYIYSTPTPTRIQRVIKTTDNSGEKKPPFKAGGVAQSLPRRSGIPRLAFRTGVVAAGAGGVNAMKTLMESPQNQQTNPSPAPSAAPAQNVDKLKTEPQRQRLMKPVQYQGSDKIREQVCTFKTTDAPNQMAPKAFDLKVQRHMGIVDQNTNATIVEDEFVNKAFIPVRVKECKK